MPEAVFMRNRYTIGETLPARKQTNAKIMWILYSCNVVVQDLRDTACRPSTCFHRLLLRLKLKLKRPRQVMNQSLG